MIRIAENLDSFLNSVYFYKIHTIIDILFNMRFDIMSTLSIILPPALANASQEAARRLGISRTQFIRQAIAHELENFQAQLEQEAIVKSISAMKRSKKYLEEAEKIAGGLNSDLPSLSRTLPIDNN
jgi:predicted transcriptional regulator